MLHDNFPDGQKPLRIGTRSSPLAMAQAHMAAAAIRAAHRLPADAVQLVPMLASGDRIVDRPLAEIGGKALWTKELERALLEDEIDMAVHSMKDVETVRPAHFVIAAMLPRADVRDRLIGALSIDALPANAKVGTSSPRRAAQLLKLRPDLKIMPIRGNVATRMAKIEQGEADATLLAAAGLDRLSMPDVGMAIPTDMLLPAASQGAVGIDCLSNNKRILAMLEAINHVPTMAAVAAERALLAALGGSCHSPVAALAEISGDSLILRAEILLEDGSECKTGRISMHPDEFERAAILAGQLLEEASPKLKALFVS